MPVLDASVVVEMLVDGEHAKLVEERIAAEEYTLWAPELLDAEVGQALRRYVRVGKLDADSAGSRLWRIDRLPVERVEHELLVHFAWVLRDHISFYDALYVALAQMLEEPLLTLDARLARAGLNAEIEVLA
ncbi:MAG TPA: type II toxin-antitoxin system VapC family toxin [Solirubrobacterales bacterium]|nr:type II toxin-antitoxin system VapC family toxin [Solirubrobacterales bacterium]